MQFKRKQFIIFTILVLLISTAIVIYPYLSTNPNDNSVYVKDIVLINPFENIKFTMPVDIQSSNNNFNQLFIVEKSGIIYSLDIESKEKKLFLDISEKVESRPNEQGLLGLAFHPEYKNNGKFYLDYINLEETTVISEFTYDYSTQKVLSDNERIILEQKQPYNNHNGGQLQFGPDGYLYISFGDGGGANDVDGNAQDRSTILGSIIRIDINTDSTYNIPQDNPFVNNSNGWREEIYAYGLRNSWRFSFDTLTGDLWAGDVGQNKIEEVDIIINGGNYGWPIMEGSTCFQEKDCDQNGLILPVAEYTHELGISITGGYVYRGDKIPELFGKYIYADYGTARFWSIDIDDLKVEMFMKQNIFITSFGTDQFNELYIALQNGSILQLSSS